MDLVITLDGVDDMAEYLNKFNELADKGFRRALEETAQFILTHYLSSMGKVTKQDRESLIKSSRVTLKGSSNSGSEMMFVWAGANKIPYHYLGKLNQSGKNVVVSADNGSHIVPDAFVINRNGRQMVFKRQGSRSLPINKQSLVISPTIQREIRSNSTIFQDFFIRSLKRHVFKEADQLAR